MSYSYNTGSSTPGSSSASNTTAFGSTETDILPEQTIPETSNTPLSEVGGMGTLSEPLNTDEDQYNDPYSGASSSAGTSATSPSPEIKAADLPPSTTITGMMGEPNVAPAERVLSGVAGVALATYAITKKRDLGGALLALAGGYLVFRGATGQCMGYTLLHTGTNNTSDSPTAVIPHNQGIKVERSVSISKPKDELYDFWRNFANLPRFMDHLESVTVQDETHSHWVAKAPLGTKVEWDAEIINEVPGEMIAWRSLEGAQIPNAGSVRFTTLPAGRGTEIKVSLEYNPPLGSIGQVVAKILGEEPKGQIHDDLARFKSLMEAGEIPTSIAAPGVPEGPLLPAAPLLPA